MIIISNHVFTDKWKVAGWCVTCISNCVLGNASLNVIDSREILHCAVYLLTCLNSLPNTSSTLIRGNTVF